MHLSSPVLDICESMEVLFLAGITTCALCTFHSDTIQMHQFKSVLLNALPISSIKFIFIFFQISLIINVSVMCLCICFQKSDRKYLI